MLLPKIIAQVLALVAAFMDKWVDVGATSSVATNCYAFDFYNVTVSDCGLETIAAEFVEDMIELTTRTDILGLFAFGY